MPNYIYKCCKCKQKTKLNLPISTDPKKFFACRCGYTMHRTIVVAQFPEKVGKVWAGDWFQKTYGHDISEGSVKETEKVKAYNKEKADLEVKGVRIRHKSRQVGGKDRISIPDKKED